MPVRGRPASSALPGIASLLFATAHGERLQILSYDPRWPLDLKRREIESRNVSNKSPAASITRALLPYRGWTQSPSLDIEVSVQQLRAIRRYVEPLARLGWVHVPRVDDAICPFFHRPKAWPHTHHVHVVQSGGDEERRTLAFRDFLREHRDIANDSAAIQKRLAALTDAADAPVRLRRAQKATYRACRPECAGCGVSTGFLTVAGVESHLCREPPRKYPPY
jgi:hypothetical protein